MSAVLHAFDFLDSQQQLQPPGLCVVQGDDRFLKRLVFAQLERLVSEPGAATRWDGRQSQWRDVADELCTVSLFGDGPRVVIVTDADEFVSRNRSQLEQLAAEQRASGCLILDVLSLPSNTRLYKAAVQTGLVVDCRPPQESKGRSSSIDQGRLQEWVVQWARGQHGIRLAPGAAEELFELVGAELGLLDQELAKLALYVGDDGKVTTELVRNVVGGWRTKTTWEMLDAALDGRAASALGQLGRLLQAGEPPQAIFGAMAWSLRRFAAAAAAVTEAEHAGHRTSLPGALEQAGFKKWPPGALRKAERQLRQIGRERANQLYGLLLEVDLATKGSHSAPDRARWAIEHLLLWLSREATP